MPSVANPLTARMGKGIKTTCDEGQTLIPGPIGGVFDGPTHSLRADGFDASEDGTGRGTPLVPVAVRDACADNLVPAIAPCLTRNYGKQPDSSDTNAGPMLIPVGVVPVAFATEQEPKWSSDLALTLTKGSPSGGGQPQCVAHAFDARQSGVTQYGDHAGPLDTHGSSIGVMTLAIRGRDGGAQLEAREDGTANAILTPSGGRAGIGVGAVAFHENQRGDIYEVDVLNAITRGGGKPGQGYAAVRQHMAVRRLTPRECERLQGFPDDFTAVPYRGKPAADGPRYKALGNSMAVPVMHWIGKRIQMVEAL